MNYVIQKHKAYLVEQSKEKIKNYSKTINISLIFNYILIITIRNKENMMLEKIKNICIKILDIIQGLIAIGFILMILIFSGMIASGFIKLCLGALYNVK